MTSGANFNVQITAKRGASSELVSATAYYFDITVIWMNIRFHDRLLKPLFLPTPWGEKAGMINQILAGRNNRRA